MLDKEICLYEMELLSQMDSDRSHCFSLLTARGRLSITSLLNTRPGKTVKPHRDFRSCDSVQTKVHTQQNKAGLTYSALMGSSLMNAGRDHISCWSKSLKCYNINGTWKPIKHSDGTGPPPRFYILQVCAKVRGTSDLCFDD